MPMQGWGRLLGRRGLGLYAVGVGASLVLSALEYVIAFFLVTFLASIGFSADTHLPSWWPVRPEDFSTIDAWLLLLAVGILRAAATVAAYHSKMVLTERTNARFKMLISHLVLKQDNPYPMPLSTMNYYMTECFPKATSFVFYLAQTTSFCVQTLVLIACMFTLARGEALIGLCGLGMMGGLVLYLNRFTNRIARRVPLAGEALEKSKMRVMRNWILIRVLRMQGVEHGKLLDSIRHYYRDSVMAYFFGNLGGALMPVFGIVLIAAMIMAHMKVFSTPHTDFIAFLYLFVRLEQRLGNGSNLMGSLFTFIPQFKESLDLFRSLPRRELEEVFASERTLSLRQGGASREMVSRPAARRRGEGPPPPAPPHIKLSDISFTWPGDRRPVIEGLSLDIPAGSQLGITGPNGAGKSTLLGILLGIYVPTAGEVRVDGEDGAAYFGRNPEAVAYVGPEPYLVNGTVLDNLVYGLPYVPDAHEVRKALSTVLMESFVESLPDGLQSRIREDGTGLSSGQKQCLTIARAFLRRPRVLVLDEPSANLDEQAETAVVNTLAALKGRCTVIIVSHRPGILRGIDASCEMRPIRHRKGEARP